MKLSTGKISVLSTLSVLRISNIFFADFLFIYPVIWDQGEYDLRELTKKYFVDLSGQPNWGDMDETTYDMLTNRLVS